MGAHAKPNTANPIGYFGTGLKYAIAVLVRLGAEPVVWIGRDRFSFSKRSSTFRGTPLETIVMRVLKEKNKRATTYELPYTTAYGKAWEVWQAFRELESNTRDEGGTIWTFDSDAVFPEEAPLGKDGITRIVADCRRDWWRPIHRANQFIWRRYRGRDPRPDHSRQRWRQPVRQIGRIIVMNTCYIPPPRYTPWYRRPQTWAGGITPTGLAIVVLLIAPLVVLGGILMAWEAYAIVHPCDEGACP